MFDTNIRVMKGELVRLQHEAKTRESDVKENAEKLKMNKQLPYLVANCIEVPQCAAILTLLLRSMFEEVFRGVCASNNVNRFWTWSPMMRRRVTEPKSLLSARASVSLLKQPLVKCVNTFARRNVT